MLYTDNYRLSSIEIGKPIIPLEDSRRMLTIDRQLLGLFQVFGNGVIAGWNIVQAGGLNVSATPGNGHVNYMSASTTDPRNIALIPNSVNYVYAQAIDETRFNRDVRFFSDTTNFVGAQTILLAKVTTSPSAVLAIDESVRNDIGFIETIKDLINQHRHRGGTENPSKIDLASEVINLLPGFRIAGIDASAIVSGRLATGRIPRLEHSFLENSGVLSHAQLDSFVRNLSNPNTRLTGELAAIDMMQLFLANKHGWNSVDAYATNLLVMIPGITPDSSTDFVNTTAVVDKVNRLIQGVPSLAGSLHSTTFHTASDFTSSFLSVNINVGSDNDGPYFNLTKPFSATVVESFDNVFADNQTFPGWTLETIASNSNSEFVSDSATTPPDEGAFSAKLLLDQSFRIQVTKFFDAKQDWSAYNELDIAVQTAGPSVAHGQLKCEILSGSSSSNYVVLDTYVLLAAHEITGEFKHVVRDISNLSRQSVIGIRMYTDTALGWDLSPVQMNVDTVRLNNNLYFLPSGIMRFRMQTPQQSKWAAISWVADTNGGSVKARARTASSFDAFDQGNSVPFQPFIDTPGQNPGVSDNTNVEVEIAVATNSGKTASPVVRSVTISFITQSLTKGITISHADQFLRATKQTNTQVASSPDRVYIAGTRMDVGDVAYGDLSSVQQDDRFGTPQVGIDGSGFPVSSYQAAHIDPTKGIVRGMSYVAAVERLYDRSYVVADTMNDRVLLVSKGGGGNIILGFASNTAYNLKNLYPIGALYNRIKKTLYVSWSTNVLFKSVDLSKFSVTGTGLSLNLSNATDTISSIPGLKSALDSGNVTAIVLSSAHAGQIETFLDGTADNLRLFLNITADAVKEGVDTSNSNYAALAGMRGMEIAVENVSFIKGLFRPVCVTRTAAGNWLVANAKPLLTNTDGTDIVTGMAKADITSVIEINPSNAAIVFSDDSVDFSLLTLGGVIEYGTLYIAEAGIATDTQPAAGAAVAANAAAANPSQTDFDVLKTMRGRVKVIERSSGRVVYDQFSSDGTYAGDVQLDADMNLVVVEKTYDGTTGKGRVVKMDDDGNVFFQFGFNELASPNDVRVLSTGNLVIST